MPAFSSDPHGYGDGYDTAGPEDESYYDTTDEIIELLDTNPWDLDDSDNRAEEFWTDKD